MCTWGIRFREPKGWRLYSLKADGAEQEDGIEEQKAQAQAPVQFPVVQMDTQNLQPEDDNTRNVLTSTNTNWAY